MKPIYFVALLPVLLALSLAQQPGATGPAPTMNCNDVRTREAYFEKLASDFGDLERYRGDNSAAGVAAPSVQRVVFMGDSITDHWGRSYGKFFPGQPYVNRGIFGQTTPQMLVRFRRDVINLKPKAVVILGGTNDIAGNTGPESLGDVENNLASMTELAESNQIKVILASVLPVTDAFQNQTKKHPLDQILTLNKWIQEYCARKNLVYIDYFSAVVDPQHMLKRELTYDGLHPNDAGYEVMGPLASAAIAKTLGK